MSECVHVTMLGNFTLQLQTQSVSSDSNRMRKVWLLLAYLILLEYRNTEAILFCPTIAVFEKMVYTG